jgi:uncharacterized phage protein (TIGR02220 family)
MAKIGWVSVNRKVMENWLWKYKPFAYGQAWIDILLECNHQEQKQMIKGQLINTKRGQSSNSMVTWARRWGWTRDRVKTFLDLLETDGMIHTKANNTTTIVTVLNYNTYQDSPTAEPPPNPTAHPQRIHTNNNSNNGNNTSLLGEIQEILTYLNRATEKNFNLITPTNQYEIKKRLSEGYTVADFKKVVDIKTAEWGGDRAKARHLNPHTLFGDKFDSYLNQRVVKQKRLAPNQMM